jgi:hypothetical protein
VPTLVQLTDQLELGGTIVVSPKCSRYHGDESSVVERTGKACEGAKTIC